MDGNCFSFPSVSRNLALYSAVKGFLLLLLQHLLLFISRFWPAGSLADLVSQISHPHFETPGRGSGLAAGSVSHTPCAPPIRCGLAGWKLVGAV